MLTVYLYKIFNITIAFIDDESIYYTLILAVQLMNTEYLLKKKTVYIPVSYINSFVIL